MEALDILAIIKIGVFIWMTIVMTVTYRYIKKTVSMIPRCVFEKSKDAYRVVVKVPKKTMKIISKVRKG